MNKPDSSAAGHLASRKRATLLGLAWGDCLGCPVEYWSKELIRRVYGRYADLPEAYPLAAIPAEPRIRGHLRPLGLHSDDTQQAITLIIACLHPQGWSLERWMQSLSAGNAAAAWRGTGRNFRATLSRLETGTPPLRCGMPSAGIGGAMRIAPVGALYAHDLEALAPVVYEATWSTHADIRAVSLALAVAGAAALLVSGRDLERVRAELVPYVARWEAAWAPASADADAIHAVSAALGRFLGRPWASLAELRSALCDEAIASGIDLENMTPPTNHAFVLLGGVHALCVALWPDGDPAELLADAIREGGDADTVGAIAGGLLGARFGDGWIPVRRCLDADALIAYAQSLTTGFLPETVDDFIAREARYSAMEREHMLEHAL